MSFDGFFTRAMTKELSEVLTGGRINRIHQPYQNEIVLNIRANRKNYKLLLSAHPSYARVQITEDEFDNPNEPPMFCTMLRKHLDGAYIQEIYQSGMDRMIIFEMRARDEIGDLSYKTLIIEIMGRHSNIILVDKEKEIIIDSVKHIPSSVNSYRTILPGAPYISPPAQEKINPLTADKTDVVRTLDFNSGKLDRQIVSGFSGISPILAKEILFLAGLANIETLPIAFTQVMEQLRNHDYSPTITTVGNKDYFHLLPLTHLAGDEKQYSTLSAMLDRFYFGKAQRERVKQQASDLERFIKNEMEKNITKLKKLADTLDEAEKADHFQLLGELLTAHMHLVKRGMDEIAVMNYYDEAGSYITIPLDPRKSPSENAQRYFSNYTKAKNAVQFVNVEIKKANEEVDYFDNLLQQLTSASTRDLEEIREELAEEGYLRTRRKKGNRKNTQQKPSLEKYIATDGTEIFVGKNNKQNDYLTSRFARKDDIWLHTKDIPGSHVVIRSSTPTEETIYEAANLAAYFSKARQSASVPVDFTKIRHVKKPNGAKPGFVIYENEQTIFITPNEDQISSMQKQI